MIITIATAISVKIDAINFPADVMMKLSSVFISVTRFDDIAPLPNDSYSFIDTFCRCCSSDFLILKVMCLDISVNIEVVFN